MHKKIKTKKNNFNSEALLLLLIIFILTQTIGLFAAFTLASTGFEGGLFTENINDFENALYLIFMILVMTGVILFLLKQKKQKNIIWLVEALAIFGASTILFETFIGDFGFLFAILLLIIRYSKKESIWIRNLASIITICGAGSMIGLSIGLVPLLIFIIGLSIYDFIAVFGTKHMVSLGKEVTQKNLAFTIAIPTKKHKFELGNGDLVIPLMVASSILVNGPFEGELIGSITMNNFIVSIFCLLVSFIGIAFSIHLAGVKKIALPALPPQTILVLIVLGIAFFIGA